MSGRQIFRKSSLEKMTTPEDLDELLQVNSARTWLLLAAMILLLAGLVIWGVMGTISQDMTGFGIIKAGELPRDILTSCPGQVDSVFGKTGDLVEQGQKLMKIVMLEEKLDTTIFSPFKGEITGLNVKEGDYVQTGSTVLEMQRISDHLVNPPEVIFFISGQEVAKLIKGMVIRLETDKGDIPPEALKGTITFIADYPASKTALQAYFPDEDKLSQLKKNDLYEVRASLRSFDNGGTTDEKEILRSMNGSFCRVVVTVARKSPVAYILN